MTTSLKTAFKIKAECKKLTFYNTLKPPTAENSHKNEDSKNNVEVGNINCDCHITRLL